MEFKYGQIYIKKDDRYLEQYIYNYIDDLNYSMSYITDKQANGDILYIFTDLNVWNAVNYHDIIALIVFWKVEHKTKEDSILTQAKAILKYN